METIRHHVADIGGQLAKLRPQIEEAWDKFVPAVAADFGTEALEATFIPDPAGTIPQLGVGGYSPGPNNILVYLDPKSDQANRTEILATLLHEAHHCLRWRSVGYGQTLGEAMVSEGLACLYEKERLGRAPIYTATELKPDQIAQAQSRLDQPGYSQAEWFFGQGDFDFWFGYSLGFRVCQQQAARTGQTAADLVDTPADEILNQTDWAACASPSS